MERKALVLCLHTAFMGLRFSQIGAFSDNTAHRGDGYLTLPSWNLLAVFDGISGDNGSGKEGALHLERALQETRELRIAILELIRSGKHASTLALAQLKDDDSLEVHNVGDSRIYLLRDGQMHRLTRDDTLLTDLQPHLGFLQGVPFNFESMRARLLELGRDIFYKEHESVIKIIKRYFRVRQTRDLFVVDNEDKIMNWLKLGPFLPRIREDQGEDFNAALLALLILNAGQCLTKSLHTVSTVSPSVLTDVRPGDLILACSDGLYENLSRCEMLEYMNRLGNAQYLADRLVLAAQLKGRKRDDITAIVGIVQDDDGADGALED